MIPTFAERDALAANPSLLSQKRSPASRIQL
jgi:hypothetical protein